MLLKPYMIWARGHLVQNGSAYKLMHVEPCQFYLQGFRWLGKLFIEVRLIFGRISSVPNYDDLHQSFSDLVRVLMLGFYSDV